MRILLIYASKTGVTKDIAQQIKINLETPISLCSVDAFNETLLKTHEIIIIGAPLYMGYVHKAMRKFIHKYQNQLQDKQIFIFSVGADSTIDLKKYLTKSYPEKFVMNAKDIKYLGGEFRLKALNPLKRLLIKIVEKERAKTSAIPPKIDQEAIGGFTENLMQTTKSLQLKE